MPELLDPTELERRLRKAVGRVVRTFPGAERFEDEVLQGLREKLLVTLPGRPPALEGHSGRGSLDAWLRACALHALTRLRASAAEDPARRRDLGDLSDEHLIDDTADPETRYLRATYAAEFRAALHEALAALDPRQRTILRLQVVEGLTGAQIGAAYGVSAPTSSRWLSQARDELRTGARRLLAERLKLSPSQLDSLAGLVLSRLEASLPRALGEP